MLTAISKPQWVEFLSIKTDYDKFESWKKIFFHMFASAFSPKAPTIDSTKNTKSLKNKSDLKPFVGLLKYYHRQFKKFAEILEPYRNYY